MRKIFYEITMSVLFVVIGTWVVYSRLSHSINFWDAQTLWSIALVLGWIIVALGYYRQGWIVRVSKSATHVSLALPLAVFIVQCILFVKGVYYYDWSLIYGAILVNSGVTFNLYQILKMRTKV